jgi:hypothetical protein
MSAALEASSAGELVAQFDALWVIGKPEARAP